MKTKLIGLIFAIALSSACEKEALVPMNGNVPVPCTNCPPPNNNWTWNPSQRQDIQLLGITQLPNSPRGYPAYSYKFRAYMNNAQKNPVGSKTVIARIHNAQVYYADQTGAATFRIITEDWQNGYVEYAIETDCPTNPGYTVLGWAESSDFGNSNIWWLQYSSFGKNKFTLYDDGQNNIKWAYFYPNRVTPYY
jgi:hypothetical protein